jgi:hypothetical protein
MQKVRGALRTEHAVGARGTRCIETDHHHIGKRNSGLFDSLLETVFDLLETDVRALFGSRRILEQTFDEELLSPVH